MMSRLVLLCLCELCESPPTVREGLLLSKHFDRCRSSASKFTEPSPLPDTAYSSHFLSTRQATARMAANGNSEPVRMLLQCKDSLWCCLGSCMPAQSTQAAPAGSGGTNSPGGVLLPRQVFLIFGKTGWIGGLVGQHLKEQGAKFEYANCRLEDRAAVISEIERVSQLAGATRLLLLPIPGWPAGG